MSFLFVVLTILSSFCLSVSVILLSYPTKVYWTNEGLQFLLDLKKTSILVDIVHVHVYSCSHSPNSFLEYSIPSFLPVLNTLTECQIVYTFRGTISIYTMPFLTIILWCTKLLSVYSNDHGLPVRRLYVGLQAILANLDIPE